MLTEKFKFKFKQVIEDKDKSRPPLEKKKNETLFFSKAFTFTLNE